MVSCQYQTPPKAKAIPIPAKNHPEKRTLNRRVNKRNKTAIKGGKKPSTLLVRIPAPEAAPNKRKYFGLR